MPNGGSVGLWANDVDEWDERQHRIGSGGGEEPSLSLAVLVEVDERNAETQKTSQRAPGLGADEHALGNAPEDSLGELARSPLGGPHLPPGALLRVATRPLLQSGVVRLRSRAPSAARKEAAHRLPSVAACGCGSSTPERTGISTTNPSRATRTSGKTDRASSSSTLGSSE